MTDKVVVFRALQLANEQRNAYGLRYNDLTRYRKHCANRTHRLRSSLKMTHGRGRDFKKLPPLTADIVKDGHLQLLLFEAERAWAYSQELTSSSLLPANKDQASSLRHSATGRFRRAVHWSTQLLSLCQSLYASSRLSAENLVEASIYTIILNGRFLRYRDDFEDALIQLSVARSLLDDLAETSSTSRDQALAILFSDEISPEIRYCAHELGRAKAYDVNGIVAEIAPKYRNELVENCDALLAKLQKEEKSSSSASNLKPITWEDQPVPVRYPELVDVLLRVQKAEAGIRDDNRNPAKKTKLGVTAYDAVLSALSDAEEVARKLQETQQLSGTSANTSTSGGRDIHFVHAYIVFQLLSRRIQRDLLLMDTLLSTGSSEKSKIPVQKKPTSTIKGNSAPVDSRLYPAIVKLLDTVLQSLTQMRTLSLVDDNADLTSAVEARISFTNARRCVYLAQCYGAVKKYAEALTLLQHASIHLRETGSSLSLSETDPINTSVPPFFSLKAEDIKELEGTIAVDGTQFKRDWFAYNGGSIKADPATYKKPLFFNIALNYVELDMDRLQHRAGKQPVPPPPVAAQSSAQLTKKVEPAPAPEKKQLPKAKVEEPIQPVPEPQPQQQPSRGGISSLLGGWWSKSSQ
ncbi:Signal recognition particle subunit SRP68 [Psilocybe cubensis]|uniref:Signal recognition particle subunit SRP68 n=2 Tax=Psilocybe cubensis TaxID=181762 RepID=A0A8H7YBG7_PSICU|nr:Signal recognition particle subunit SRP68 [Psilocybe cubensis]KAH9487176.1 Signal recognition particle subunit SRP68 [Psilocybe cubensis]